MTGPIPYYRVHAKNNRAFWCPSRNMRRQGFSVMALGFDGPEARARAAELNTEWQALRSANGYEPTLAPRGLSRALHYVYFVRIEDRIKIGFSRRPLSRLPDVVAGAPGPLGAAIVVRGTAIDERRLLDRFHRYRIRGEWFMAVRPLLLTMTRSTMAGRVVHDDDSAGTESGHGVETVSSSGRSGVESQNRGSASV